MTDHRLLRPLLLMRWLLLASLVAVLAGSASALFLKALDQVGLWRDTHHWLVALLPMAGFAVGWIYWRWGQRVEAGNNLLIDEIHDPRNIIPLRMAPLVLGGTLISHLFGASVGREGTAVQMGGSLADQLTRLFRLGPDERRILLMAGMSAGFAAVFGTPLAGAVFGLEVLAVGRMRYDAIFPCFVAAILADQVCLAWGIVHTAYSAGPMPAFTLATFAAVVAAGILFGCVGRLFAWLVHELSARMRRHVPWPPLRQLAGGLVIAAALLLLPADRYMGLGIPVIVEAFQQPLSLVDSVGKLAFTVAALGSGFKGGEVTPLFYIGATFGNALAPLLHLPFGLLAALGFVAVFAGAANIPLAATLMAMEVFGAPIGPWAALACVMSFLFSGTSGIYRAQKNDHPKHLFVSAAPAAVPPAGEGRP